MMNDVLGDVVCLVIRFGGRGHQELLTINDEGRAHPPTLKHGMFMDLWTATCTARSTRKCRWSTASLAGVGDPHRV